MSRAEQIDALRESIRYGNPVAPPDDQVDVNLALLRHMSVITQRAINHRQRPNLETTRLLHDAVDTLQKELGWNAL